nr:hypothetical protein CFP56_18831 [Quercus suber]
MRFSEFLIHKRGNNIAKDWNKVSKALLLLLFSETVAHSLPLFSVVSASFSLSRSKEAKALSLSNKAWVYKKLVDSYELSTALTQKGVYANFSFTMKWTMMRFCSTPPDILSMLYIYIFL